MSAFRVAPVLVALASGLGMIGSPRLAFAGDHATRLAAFFDDSLLGAQVPYLEHDFGPAKYVQDGVRTYVVDGCEVFVRTARNSVRAMGLRLTPNCSMALAELRFDGASPERPTFGTFYGYASRIRFTADCLKACGNAFDPAVIGTFYGFHSNAFIGWRAGSSQSEGRALNAANSWRQAMEKAHGEQWVIANRFNCTDDYDDAAKELFKDIPIQWVEVGFFDNVEGCANPAKPALRR